MPNLSARFLRASYSTSSLAIAAAEEREDIAFGVAADFATLVEGRASSEVVDLGVFEEGGKSVL